MKFNPRRRDGSPAGRYYTIDRKLLIHSSEMPSPRSSRKAAAASESVSVVTGSSVVDSGPTAADAERPPRSQDEVNAAFEQLASSAVQRPDRAVPTMSQSPERPLQRGRQIPSPDRLPQRGRQAPSPERPPQRGRQIPSPERPPQHRRPAPSPERPPQQRRQAGDPSPERPPQQRSRTAGDAGTSAAEPTSAASPGGVTSSPLPPPSPKSLSRSPSLRRRGVWQPGHTPPPEVRDKPEDAPLDIKEPVWTPKSSPTTERKQYRTINFDSSSLERKKTESPAPPSPPPPPSESYAWQSPEVPERHSVPVRSSLPRPESATVTLLREARQGHLPRGAQYLSHQDGGLYDIPRNIRPPPVKEVEGVGPTIQGGMPVSLRSTVKGENQQDWYRRVYDNLHRQPQGRSSYGLGGYCSEPELNNDDDFSPRWQARRADRYKGQPGRIEDYTPGRSSLAQQEAAKYWAEVMGYFDKFLEEHSHIKLERPLRGVRSAGNRSLSPPHDSFTQRVLDGYESDSTLVYHRSEPLALTSGEQRSYYHQIQRGGDVPLTGLRKPAPEKPRVVAPRYQEAAVNIHYRSPVRWEEKEPLSEQELRRRQEDAMRRVYQEARRSKEQRQAEDRISRRHGDNFTPSQKSPIPLDRYERLFDDATDDRQPTVTATALHEFRAQNNRELSLVRGDTVKIRRKVDANWYEGQKGTRIGIFPVTYVQVNDVRERPSERWTARPQVRARHKFVAQTSLELSLNKGDVVTVLRRVDDNWYEGRRGDHTGIFPISYVEPVSSDTRDSRVPRVKPVGAPAAHGLVMDGSSLGAPAGSQGQLRVDVQQDPLTYRVLFPYRHQNEDELDLEEGDLIHVLEQCPDGWYVGTNLRTGMFGTFPGNYTQKM